MMEVVFDGAKDFADLMASIGSFVEEAAFRIDEEAMTFRAMDPSRVVMIDLELPAFVFSKYDVRNSETIGLNMEKFLKVLKLAKSKDTLILRKSPNSLEVILHGEEVLKFRLPLIDAEEFDVEMPELPFTVEAVLLGVGFKRAIKAAALVSDSVRFIGTQGKLVLKAVGDDTEVETVLTLEDEVLLDLTIEKDAKTACGLNYLEDIAKKLSDGQELFLKFGEYIPLLLKYPVRDEGSLTFLIAPRVE